MNCEKRNVYFVQVSASFGGSNFLPYSVGCLAAYAFSFKDICENYQLADIIYERKLIEQSLSEIKNPFIVGFSAYVWNYEYNICLAKRIKEKYPDCIIVFGGHDVPLNSSMLSEYDFIDILIHDEGEIPFSQLLRYFAGDGELKSINNISYRNENRELLTNKIVASTDVDYPSPYTTGIFDKIMQRNDCQFVATFETNRGCPFKCAYCDWDTIKEEVRKFPIEKIKAEIEWIAEHKIEFTWLIDGNFGLFERDEEIVDFLIETKEKTGYPKRTNLFYTKNNPSYVFRLNKKLDDAGLSKGACISFQSMCPQVLENIGRQNISNDKFKELMTLYNKNNIPTFTEIIVGLPGETYESFCDGINTLLNAGQHYSFYVYPCELLKNSIMARPDYIQKYGIKYVITTLNQHHRETPKDEIEEYSRIVVGSDTMPPEKWVQSCMFAICVRTFHSLGILQYFALYLKAYKNVEYKDFYHELLNWMLSNPDSTGGKVFTDLKNRYEKITNGNGSFVYAFPEFGDVVWPFEEGAFLQIVNSIDEFFDEIVEFLSVYNIDKNVFDELLFYQKKMIKTPGNKNFEMNLSYDFPLFIRKMINNELSELQKRETKVKVYTDYIPTNLPDFAREVVWYGRKGGKTLLGDDITVG